MFGKQEKTVNSSISSTKLWYLWYWTCVSPLGVLVLEFSCTATYSGSSTREIANEYQMIVKFHLYRYSTAGINKLSR